jgi:cyanophycinase
VLATAGARQGAAQAVRNAKAWFADLGATVEELPATRRSHVSDPANAALAATGRLFYLVGGDPGIVPKILAGSPVWDAIVAAWQRGAALAGSSAGAMALGEWTLIRDRMPGDDRRRYADALGIIPRVAVVPHFDTFGHRWVDSALEHAPEGAVLLGLDERTGAVWQEKRWRVLGDSVTVITASERRAFRPGDGIEGLPVPG